MKVKIIYTKNGEVKKVVGNVGRTRMSKAALVLWRGEIEPTTGYKLRRFFKRLGHEISRRANMAANFYDEETVIPLSYVGLLEDKKKKAAQSDNSETV